MQVIKKGAESEIILDKSQIRKVRLEKKYRHRKIDKNLREKRTKYESKILEKLQKLEIPAPKFIEKNDFEIKMEFIKGSTLKEILDKKSKNLKKYYLEIGELIAKIHDKEIIHGDLTTSNLILEEKTKKIHLIDFGLSFHSQRDEDKAVDLRVLEQALKSGHPGLSKAVFRGILLSYEKSSAKGKTIIRRLEKIRARGRYK